MSVYKRTIISGGPLHDTYSIVVLDRHNRGVIGRIADFVAALIRSVLVS